MDEIKIFTSFRLIINNCNDADELERIYRTWTRKSQENSDDPFEFKPTNDFFRKLIEFKLKKFKPESSVFQPEFIFDIDVESQSKLVVNIPKELEIFETTTFNDENENDFNNDCLATNFERIRESNFHPIIQNWLAETARKLFQESNLSYYRSLWSQNYPPWSFDRLERDISRYESYDDYEKAIEVAKIVLKNGTLDYHEHSETIVQILTKCSRLSMQMKNYKSAIQFASEALFFDKNDSNALSTRAGAFFLEKMYQFSKIDYSRIDPGSFNHYEALNRLKQIKELNNETEINDDNENFFLQYWKKTTKKIDGEILKTFGDELSNNGCFVLSIIFYTESIKYGPETSEKYQKLGESYRKLHEPSKSIKACGKALELQPNNIDVLYCKALAHQQLNEMNFYQSMLEKCLEIEPENQILLMEHYSSKNEKFPRSKRRIRVSNNDEDIFVLNEPANLMSYEQLDEIRFRYFSSNEPIESVVNSPFENQCAFVLDLKPRELLRVFRSASVSLIKLFADVGETMVYAEEQMLREQSTSFGSFSFQEFTLNLLIGLTNLSELDDALSKVDDQTRTKLNNLISFLSNCAYPTSSIEKLKRLKR